MRKAERISQHNNEKNQRLEELSRKHNDARSKASFFAKKNLGEDQDEEREDLIRELNDEKNNLEKVSMDEKANIIKNFPIPNAKEDLLELLAMATSNAYDNDGIIGKEEEVWLQKADQIYQKIIVCAANDDAILEQASNMIFSLMKRLPREYKSFTSIPLNLKRKYEEELQADKNHKAEQKKSVFIKFGASGIGVIILGVIVFFRGLQYGWTPLLIGLGLLIAGIILVNKWKKEKRDIDTYFN